MTEWYDRDSQPRFERPPVIETAMGIEFFPVPGLDLFRLSILQTRWLEEYPRVQDALGAPPSQLVDPSTTTMQFQLNMGQGPVRYFADNPAHGLLVQTQSDRLLLNWRSTEAGASTPTEYPRFDALRTEFVRLWSLFTEFLAENGLPAPVPVLSEYTYVNVIPLEIDDGVPDVVAVVKDPPDALPGRELLTRFQLIRNVDKNAQHPMTAQVAVNGEPQAEPRRFVLNVSTRAIFNGTEDDPVAGIDVAHALSSFTFSRLITAEKRAAWGAQL